MKISRTIARAAATLIIAAGAGGCVNLPEGTAAVDDFELDRYLGTWYEIARLDHSFERGLSNVTANYSLRDDGGVRVVNRGFNEKKNRWSESEGKAYFVGDPDVGRLKVSFFGPFYGAYNIIELDKDDYQYSLVVGPNRKYLWILSRSPELDAGILAMLVDSAETLGFPVDALIYVEQSTAPTTTN
jgi:apolipoprotein D and lipocalin family protein